MKRVMTLILALLMIFTMFACSAPVQEEQAAPAQSGTETAQTQPGADAAGEQAQPGGETLRFPDDKTYKIGFATREIVNDLNRDVIAGAQEVIEAAGGEMTVVNAGADVTKHNENIENLINSGVDGIIVELGDAQQLEPLVAKANEAGIPVVTTCVMAYVPGSVTDISADEVLTSTLASRMLLSAMDYEGDLYVFWVPGAPLLEQRKRALEALLVDFPQVHMIEVPTEHDPATVQSQMEDILTANPDAGSVGGVWCAYDQLGTGAYQAIMAAGRDEIKLASCDGDRISYSMLFAENSPYVAIGAENVKELGIMAGQSMLLAIHGRADEVPKAQYTTSYGVTRWNGIAAAETRFGEGVWDDLGLDKNEIAKQFPQTQDVYVVKPLIP